MGPDGDLWKGSNDNSGSKYWHAGNDGSGSGLDADLLDGRHLQQVARFQSGSDFANGTLVTTDISSSGTNGDSFVIEITGKAYGSSRPHSVIAEGYLYNNTIINTNGTNIGGSNFTYLKVMSNGGYLSFWWPRHGYWNSYDVHVRSSSGGTANYNRVTAIANSVDPSGASKKIQINLATSWTSSNDGSGSGLDADLLDGVNGASYLRSDANDVYNGTLTINGMDFKVSNVVRNLKIQASTGGSDVGISGFRADGTHGFQVYADGTNYGFLDGNWANWDLKKAKNGAFTVDEGSGLKRVLNEANWTSYITLPTNSDTVDNLHAASFLRSDAADSFNSTITMATQKALVANDYGQGVYGKYSATRHQHVWSMGTSYNLGSNGQSVGNLYGLSYTHTNIGTGYGSNAATGLGHQLNGRANGTLQWALGDGIWSSNTGNVWGASNDGSGSGLDADTIDGIDSARIIYGGNATGTYNANPTVTSSPYQKSGFYDVNGTGNNAPTNTYYSYINMRHTNTANNHGHQIAGSFYSQGDIYNRQINNNSYGSWSKIWNTTNDGSGSTLDADLLDGQHGSYYYAASNPNGYTNDQTAAEILAALKTVDVNGTAGVNAGTFDGVVSTSFLRSDTSDTMTGELNVTRNGGMTGSSAPQYGNANIELQTSSNHAPAISFHRGGYSATTLYEYDGELYTNAWVSRAQTGKLVSSGNIGSYAWTSSNDGSGSGLDADSLDGIQASSFMRGGRTLTTINTISNGGDRYDPSTNNPTNEHYAVLTYGNGGNVTGQLATHFQTGNLYSRGYNNAWSNWRTYWNSLNDGSGSGLDADLLDGLELHTARNNEVNKVVRTDTNGYIQAGWINTTSGSTTGTNRIYASNDGYIRYVTPATFISNLGLFTTSNDGSGSGLDADTVDGIQGAAIVKGGTARKSSQVSAFAGVNEVSGFYFGNNVTSAPTTDWINYIHSAGNSWSSSNNYSFQLTHAFHSDSLWVSRTTNGSQSTARKIWDSASDGPGSGLDADTVDTIQASSLLRSDTADTFTGTLTMGTQQALVANNYGRGVFGVYSATRYQHVWSMGTAYKTSDDGTSYGNMYGLTYTHTNIGTGTNQAISGLSHQLQHRQNGVLNCAFGTGIWTSGNVTAYSDIAVKTNLVRIPNALEKVCSINGYTYERTDYIKDLEDPEAPDVLRQAGVVAQEIEKVLPEVVSGKDGNKAVAYGNVVALLIESIKELKDEVDELKKQLKEK
jgi:hypothetical protein